MAELNNYIDKWCQMDLEMLKHYLEHFSAKEFAGLLISDCRTYEDLQRLYEHFFL